MVTLSSNSVTFQSIPKPISVRFIVVKLRTDSPDRLVEDEERRWTDENIDMVALKHFPNIDRDKALNRPILYSNWLSKVSDQLN